MRIHRIAAVLWLLVALTPAVPARAGAQLGGVLADDAAVVRWQGQFTAAATGPVAPDPATCAASPTCDQVTLDLTMPASTWTGAPGGLLVAVQWPVIDWGYDLDLYVYRLGDSTPVASSTSTVFSRFEAAWVQNPSPGRYLVVVAGKSVVSQQVVPDVLTELNYRGAAHLQRGLTVERTETNLGAPFTRRLVAFDKRVPDATPLLPDLVPTRPSAFYIESSWGAQYYFYGDRGLRHQPSCYPQETLGLTADDPRPAAGPLRCLRWDQGEYNLGDGPLELHNYPDQASGTEMWQRVYAADGSLTQVPVGQAKFSSSHGHLHYLGFTLVTLHAIGPDGSLGAELVRAPDKGICVVDIEVGSLDGDRTSPLSYGVPGTCDAASHADPHDPTYPGSSYFAMGISVGSADIYPWFIADQYIDVTKVPDGRYLLRVEIDTGRQLREKSHGNNLAITCIGLHGDRAALC